MKKTFFLFLAAALALGIGTTRAENTASTLQIKNLRGVEAHTGFTVSLSQGDKAHAVVTVDSRLQPYLRTEVDDGVLTLVLDNVPVELQGKNLLRKAEVTVTSLEVLRTHSGARITGEGALSADEADITAHSGGHIDISISAKDVDISVHSGAKATVSGTAQRLEAKAHSGASADLAGLKAQNVSASAHSGARITCAPQLSLDANAHSAGSVRYLGCGTLKSVATDSHSAGSVRKID